MQKIATKLLEIQKKLSDTFFSKNEKAFSYKYATLNSIQEIVVPILSDMNILLINKTENNAIVTVLYDCESGESVSSAKDIGKILSVKKSNYTDKYGKEIEEIETQEQDPQAVGAIDTYYRRYNLLTLLNLKTGDDDGASASARAKSAQSNADVARPAFKPAMKTENVEKLIELYKAGEVTGTPQEVLAQARNKYFLDPQTEQEILDRIRVLQK